jgi:DNA-directed RNA polymerase beta' subunit
MRKIIKLTESDLTRIVRRVIIEDNKQTPKVGDSNNLKNLKTYLKELVDESVIDNDVKVHIMFLVKKLIEENKK